jgi:hypothetical protein
VRPGAWGSHSLQGAQSSLCNTDTRKTSSNSTVSTSCNNDHIDSYSHTTSVSTQRTLIPLSAHASLAEGPPNRNVAPDEFIIDLGTTEHICQDRASFVHLSYFATPRHIYVGDDRWLPATAFGPVEVRTMMPTGAVETTRLENCWFAPDFRVNLLSTGRLNDAGLTSTFRPDKTCTVTDSHGKTILRGRRRSSGTVLDAHIVRHVAEAALSALQAVAAPGARSHAPLCLSTARVTAS